MFPNDDNVGVVIFFSNRTGNNNDRGVTVPINMVLLLNCFKFILYFSLVALFLYVDSCFVYDVWFIGLKEKEISGDQ